MIFWVILLAQVRLALAGLSILRTKTFFTAREHWVLLVIIFLAQAGLKKIQDRLAQSGLKDLRTILKKRAFEVAGVGSRRCRRTPLLQSFSGRKCQETCFLGQEKPRHFGQLQVGFRSVSAQELLGGTHNLQLSGMPQAGVLPDFGQLRLILGQVRLGQVRLGQVCQVRLGQVRLGQVRLQLFVFEVIFRIFLGQPKIFLVLT